MSKPGKELMEKEIKEFNDFMEELRDKGFVVDVARGEKKIKQGCGKGFYETAKKALFQFKHRDYRLVFEDGKDKKSCWPSAESGRIVINMARISGLEASLPGVIEEVLAEDRALIK